MHSNCIHRRSFVRLHNILLAAFRSPKNYWKPHQQGYVFSGREEEENPQWWWEVGLAEAEFISMLNWWIRSLGFGLLVLDQYLHQEQNQDQMLLLENLQQRGSSRVHISVELVDQELRVLDYQFQISIYIKSKTKNQVFEKICSREAVVHLNIHVELVDYELRGSRLSVLDQYLHQD